MEKLVHTIALVLCSLSVANSQLPDCAADGFTVNIRIGLSGSIVSTPSLIAPLESSLILSCIVTITGQNAPEVTSYSWYHRGNITTNTDANFGVSSVSGSDGGEYTCRATTPTCMTQSSPIFTVNTNVPDLTVSMPDENGITINERESFSLSCQATGWPIPTIQWELLDSGGITRVVANSGDYTVGSASLMDAGRYTCRARNGPGQEALEFRNVTIIALPTTEDPDGNGGGNMVTLSNADTDNTNGTDTTGFYIAIGITAGVSLALGVASLICCVISLYMQFCYKGPTEPPSIYDDWPDGEQGLPQEGAVKPPTLSQPTHDQPEGVTAPADQWAGPEGEEEKEVMETVEEEEVTQEEATQEGGDVKLAASPSEVGAMV